MSKFIRSWRLLIGAWLVLITLTPSAAWAQNAEARPISLMEALQTSLERNFDIRLQALQTDIAANNNHWGTAGRYPTVSLQLGSNNRLSDIDNPASFLNGQFSNLGLSGTVNVGWTIFNGFRVNITKARLELLEQQSAGNAALVVENTIQAIVLQYYTCLLEAERLEVLRSNLVLSRDRMAFAESKREIGTGLTFDVLNAQTAYFADSSNVLLQEMNVLNSQRNLAQLLGYGPEVLLQPSGQLEPVDQMYDVQDLRQAMTANNQTLINQFINLEILQKDVELAKASRYPTVTVNAGGTYSTNRLALDGRDPVRGSQVDYFANFSLNFTLYNGGIIRRSIENAAIAERISRLGIEQIEQAMDHQLYTALDMYQTRLRLLSLAEANIDLAEQNEQIAEEKFKTGTLNSFNYRDVQMMLLQVRLNHLQAIYNALEANLNLVRLTGGLLDMVKQGE